MFLAPHSASARAWCLGGLADRCAPGSDILGCTDHQIALLVQIASVMGMSVSAHLLNAAYPIAISADALERDLLELEKANFLRSTDVPGTWLMTQVSVSCLNHMLASVPPCCQRAVRMLG